MSAVGDRTRTLGVIVALWLGAVASGFRALWVYSGTPGVAVAATSPAWPVTSRLRRIAGRPAVVLFLHPRCPCSRATINELARILTQVGRHPPTAHVVLVKPDAAPAGWEATDLRDRALEVVGSDAVSCDEGGVEVGLFGATTSGSVLVYDAAGALVFRGGITAARGHEGESAGGRRVLAALRTGTPDRGESEVFGCRLRDPG